MRKKIIPFIVVLLFPELWASEPVSSNRVNIKLIELVSLENLNHLKKQSEIRLPASKEVKKDKKE